MANSRPRKVGEYERPARGASTAGKIIGGLVLLALIILAIVFLTNKSGDAAVLPAGERPAITALRSDTGPSALVQDSGVLHAAHRTYLVTL